MNIFTYPNISPFNRNGRGGMVQRQNALRKINKKYNTTDFQLIEIPADFIKNKTEIKKTGRKICSFIDHEFVKRLYKPGFLDKNIKYVLHTDPALERRIYDNQRVLKCKCTPQLKWYNTDWIKKFTEQLCNIIDFFEITPYAIEIHPGNYENGKNNIHTFSKAIEILHKSFENKYQEEILIFIENRTGQHIKDGNDIKEFWNNFMKEYPDLTSKTGIILDIQQFYTVNRSNFITEFSKIPKESLFGVHIHKGRHQVPEPDDLIPWKYVSQEISNLGNFTRPLHVLPEVHHSKNVEATYEFCKNYLGL